MALAEQTVDQVRAQKTSAAGDQHALLRRI
jgi:hypothetical protein